MYFVGMETSINVIGDVFLNYSLYFISCGKRFENKLFTGGETLNHVNFS